LCSQLRRHSTATGTVDTPGRSSGCLCPWPLLPLGDSLALPPGGTPQSLPAMGLWTIQLVASDSGTLSFRQRPCASISPGVHVARLARNRVFRPSLLCPGTLALSTSGTRDARQIRSSLTAPARARRPPIARLRKEMNCARRLRTQNDPWPRRGGADERIEKITFRPQHKKRTLANIRRTPSSH